METGDTDTGGTTRAPRSFVAVANSVEGRLFSDSAVPAGESPNQAAIESRGVTGSQERLCLLHSYVLGG